MFLGSRTIALGEKTNHARHHQSPLDTTRLDGHRPDRHGRDDRPRGRITDGTSLLTDHVEWILMQEVRGLLR